MATQLNDEAFTVSIVGEETKEKWFGEFRALRRLSHRQQMERDRIRRGLLGDLPQYASARTMEQAIIFADLAVSVTKSPKWWAETGQGQDLVDDNVLREVWKGVQKVQGNVLEEEKKETEEAVKVLKKAVENPEPEEKEESKEE